MPMRPLSVSSAKTNLAGGELALIGADGPSLIVEIEQGVNRDKVHVGLIVGVQGADIPPVFDLLFIFILKVVSKDSPVLNHRRKNVLAEIVCAVMAIVFS